MESQARINESYLFGRSVCVVKLAVSTPERTYTLKVSPCSTVNDFFFEWLQAHNNNKQIASVFFILKFYLSVKGFGDPAV
jgi:hypothetical protein